ncbi:hypothetical protein, partial [Natronococcus sp. A-GB7]|uniref:hypothetical protein n=1 Tax=Natronococcus sp. A-GB7 TaxID=3037649 RepID=UPI00241EE905
NGKSFEVLVKGDSNRQEEISLIQFDLNDLKAQPELLEILSKDSIQSGKSDEIAMQIAQTGEAIAHLRENGDQVAEKLNSVLLDEIGGSVPLDTEAQATEFVDSLVSALEEQRSAIGTTTLPAQEETPVPEQGDHQEALGDYVAKIRKNGDTLAAFGGDNQSDTMEKTVNYLVENYGLISEIGPMPYIPGREKAIINETPTSPHDEEAMRTYRELSNGYYLDTHASKETKIRTIGRLADECDLEVEFEGEW